MDAVDFATNPAMDAVNSVRSMSAKSRLIRRRARRAFSLIELLLVLVILAILATVVVTNFAGKPEKARIAATQTDINSIDAALDAFRSDAGRYPTNEEGLQALIDQPSNVKSWDGPYLKRGLPKDQWGNPFVYRAPGVQNKTGIDLFSMGPDGHEGGDDDITNWSAR